MDADRMTRKDRSQAVQMVRKDSGKAPEQMIQKQAEPEPRKNPKPT